MKWSTFWLKTEFQPSTEMSIILLLTASLLLTFLKARRAKKRSRTVVWIDIKLKAAAATAREENDKSPQSPKSRSNIHTLPRIFCET
jgi:hypothetical protein